MRYDRWLSEAAQRLAQGESPRRDAEILLGFVTGKARTYLIAFGETELNAQELAQLETLLARRERGEPVAYLIGEREFWSLPLAVSPATLIPRPDTECLVEKALTLLPEHGADVLDLGTGTGAIALALAHERPDCRVTGVDFSAQAVALAQGNATRLGIANITFMQSDWFSQLSGQRFALIASNPPYIDADDPHLSQGDVRFEPASALVAGQQGMADIIRIVDDAPDYLLPGGWLLLEHGWQQGEAVRACLTQRGFSAAATLRDYGGNERVSFACWAPAGSGTRA